MRVEEKTNGTECNGKRKKLEDKSIFQERGCVFVFWPSFDTKSFLTQVLHFDR